jgi:hypothetical protein
MKNKKTIRIFLSVLFLIGMLTGAHSTTLGQDTITVQGRARLEGVSNHSNINIELWFDATSSNTVATTVTDNEGFYVMNDVPAITGTERYGVYADYPGFSYENDLFYPWHVPQDGVMVVDEMVLHSIKPVRFDWVFQPDGSTDFSGAGLPNGSATLHSNRTSCGFIFADNDITGFTADIYFSDKSNWPLTFWANNGTGGVHDMGEVFLDSITEAPDKSNGVGAGQFYNNQATNVTVGHTYCIVTRDGNYYAKLNVTGVCDEMDSDCDAVFDNDNCPGDYNTFQEDNYPPGGNSCGDACECEGNFDGDDDQDGTDAFTFKEDFGRNLLRDPCTFAQSCNGNFDCDEDVDGTDAFTFKEDFGRSPLLDPCPDCLTIPWCN